MSPVPRLYLRAPLLLSGALLMGSGLAPAVQPARAAPSGPAAWHAQDSQAGARSRLAQAGSATPTDPPAQAAEDPAHYVSFVLEDDSDCMLRDGKHVLVRNLHPTRTIRVWLDRYYRNAGTGDRSRSDLKPGEAGEPLGCSRVDNANQEWRIVRAVFLD